MNHQIFATALLNPDAAIPDGLTDPQGRPAPRRFNVYRNNVAVSLTRALEAGFPVIRNLVGADFFGAMAVAHLRDHPPRSRQLMFYGEDLPGFLETFPPVAHLPYLPDVARLELAIRQSYHAADSAPVDAVTLALPEETLLAARFHLAPSLRLIRSAYPVHAIWMANTQGGPPPQPGAQDVVVLRVDYDPAPHLLPPGGGAFIARLLAGDTLMQSLNAAGEGFDLPAVLSLLVSRNSLAGLTP